MAGKSDIKAGSAFVELFVKGAKFEVGLRKAAASLKKFGDDLTAIGTKLATFGTIGGTGIGLAAKRFADFDDAIRAAAASIDATDAEMIGLTATARRLGSETGLGALSAANLMIELGRAGFVAAEVDKMTGAVMNLSRATGTDATLSAGIMASVIRQFGLAATDAARVADVMTSAANKSFTSVEQLGEAFSYAGPVAHDFGMSLEDTAAIFGGLGNVGIQASNAGTAVRRLLTLTASEATKMKEIFGVTFVDAAGDARPLVDVLEEVNLATKDMGSAERASKFNEAFGLLGITAASAIGNTVGSIRELREALGSAAGVAETTAEKMNAGLGGAFRKLLSSGESVAIQIGDVLAPALQKVAAIVTDFGTRLVKWIDANRELIVAITAAVAAIGILGLSLMAVGIAASTAGAGLAAIATVFGVVLSAAAAMLSPIGLVVAGVAALGAAIVATTGVVPKLIDSLKPLMGAVKEIATSLLSGDFKRAWDVAATSIKYVASVALDWFVSLPELAGYAAGAVARAIIDGLSVVWEWVKSMPSLIESMLMGDVDLGAALSGSIEAALGKIKSTADAMKAGWRGDPMPELGSSERTKRLKEALEDMAATKLTASGVAVGQGGGKAKTDAKKEADKKAAAKARGDGPVSVTFSAAALVAQAFGGSAKKGPEDKIVAKMEAELAESKKMVKILGELLDKARKGGLVFG